LGAYVGFRSPEKLKEKLDISAEQAGRSLSAETALRVETTFRDEGTLDQAMALAHGGDNAALLHLFGHVLRVVAPYGGQWLEDDAASTEVARGIVHMLRRLRAPDDGHVAEAGTVEGRVDSLIYDSLGYEAGEHDISARARWAGEQRRRMGPAIGERLLRIRRAMKAMLEAGPPREMQKPDPAAAALWEPAIARLNARKEGEGEDA
jgi:hypothetical protein